MVPRQFGGDSEPSRPLWRALRRGWRRRCPACGRAAMLFRYLKVHDRCSACDLELHHQRADDAPPYFTITIVAHIIMPALLISERLWHPPEWLHMTIWIPLTLGLTLFFLPRVKGALIGLQWAKAMHGFGGPVQD